jgi:hypothetical protein
LTKVLVIEMDLFKTVPDIDALCNGLEWEYPQEVLDEFHRASIELKVILRNPA